MTEQPLSVAEAVNKIRSSGYWEVVIRPLAFNKARIGSLGSCKEIVEESKVQFRGWDYPHISNKYGVKSGIDWVENLTDWSDHLEYWRMYQSAQFFHVFACREDWWGNVRIFWASQAHTTVGYGLEIMCTLYTLTEIHEFAARLVKKQIFDDSLSLSITLNKMKNRRLVTSEIDRNLGADHISNVETIPLARIMTVDEIIGRSKEFAVDDTIKIFECFNWFNPPRRIFEEEQDKLLRGL